MSEKYKNLKVKELQELLQKNNLPHTGKKEELIDRLIRNDERTELDKLEKEFELSDDFFAINAETNQFELLSPLDFEKVLSDDEDDLINSSTFEKEVALISAEQKAPETVARKGSITTSTEKTNKSIVTDLETPKKEKESKAAVEGEKGSLFKFTPITFEKKATVKAQASKVTITKVIAPVAAAPAKKKEVAVAKTSLLDNKATEKIRIEAERRLERSKRFGIKLDDQEKKVIRAARFGIVTSPTKEDDKKKENTTAVVNKKKLTPEEERLQKRAERFGIENKTIVEKKEEKGSLQKKQTIAQKSAKVSKKGAATTKNKNHVAALKVKQGRVAKNSVKIAPQKTTNSNNQNNVRGRKQNNIIIPTSNKNTLLNKKKIEKMGIQTNIAQNKRKIINKRQINITNGDKNLKQVGDRIVTIKSTPTKSASKQPSRIIVKENGNNNKNARNASFNKKIEIAANSNKRVVTQLPKSNRKRGRGINSPQPQSQPQQRVNNNRNKRQRR